MYFENYFLIKNLHKKFILELTYVQNMYNAVQYRVNPQNRDITQNLDTLLSKTNTFQNNFNFCLIYTLIICIYFD